MTPIADEHRKAGITPCSSDWVFVEALLIFFPLVDPGKRQRFQLRQRQRPVQRQHTRLAHRRFERRKLAVDQTGRKEVIPRACRDAKSRLGEDRLEATGE